MTINDTVNHIMTIRHSDNPKLVREFDIARVLVDEQNLDSMVAICIAQNIVAVRFASCESVSAYIRGIIIGYNFGIIDRKE